MRRTKKVITSAKFRTSDSAAPLNLHDASRSLTVGCRADESANAMGLIGKVSEQSAGKSILDYGVWTDLAFPHVVGIFGTRGTGKSYDLGVFAECAGGLSDIVSEVPPPTAVVLFDVQNQFWTLGLPPKKELIEDRLHLESLSQWGLEPSCLDDVNLWLPCGCETSLPGTKVFRLSPSQLEDSDWLALLELERYSPMGQAMIALLNDGGLKDPESLANRAQVGRALANFQQGTVDALRWRLQSLVSTDLVGETGGIDVGQFLVPGRVSVLLLRDLPESLRSLAVGVLMRLFASRMGVYHQRRRVVRRQGGKMPEGGYLKDCA